MSAPTPPKGSLEDLFRHHLLESGAAAVPPRPQVWEQLDNSLLLAQNEQYRRRLRAYRWAVAASLLLTALAGTGWWRSQQQTAVPLAQATANEAAARSGAGAAAGPAAAPSLATSHVASTSSAASIAQPATLPPFSSPTTAALPAGSQRDTRYRQPGLAVARPIQLRAAKSASAQLAFTERPAKATSFENATARVASQAGEAGRQKSAASRLVGLAGRPAIGLPGSGAAPAAFGGSPGTATGDTETPVGLAASRFSSTAPQFAAAPGSSQLPSASTLATGAAPADVAARWSASPDVLAELNNERNPELLTPPNAEPLRMGREATVATSHGPDRPTGLRGVVAGAGLPITAASEWQGGVSYAVSTFQPNIDFLKASDDYNPVYGAASAYFTQVASTEYRDHLRAGLSQRLSVWASRRLGAGHWSLRLGAEASHNEAHSASSVNFVGEQVYRFAYGRPVAPQLRSTSYGYSMVSLPVELRRGNTQRTGWSLYGRLGGAISGLFNVRSDVTGNSEASRTYSITSDNSPYRRVTASLRGGLGLQLRPASHQWTFSLGPMAEGGIFSLNKMPGQGFWQQQRPYSLGLEAGVELGGVPHLLLR